MNKTLCLLLFCYNCFVLKAQTNQNIISSKLDITDNNDYSTFAMLDSILPKYTVFFTGENHLHRKSNYMLQLKMLKYLNQKIGLRHLFLEFGYSRGYLVNRYVQTGDSSLFNILNDYSYDEYALLYKGIWEYNRTLDSNKRIIVTGIDVERSYHTAIKLLEMFLPLQNPPAEIEIHIEALKSLAKMSDKKMQETKSEIENDKKFKGETFSQARTMDYIMQNIDSLNEIWKNYLGSNFDNFNLILKGLKAEKQRTEYMYKNTPHHYIYREQYMYEQMFNLIEKYPGEKFYGQFGRCHTPINEQEYWCGYYYVKTLASRLNHSPNEKVKNKVLSIATYYPEGTTHEKKIVEDEKLKKIMNNKMTDTITLIKVNNDTTLFGAFEKKYQYLIINKNKHVDDILKKEKNEVKKQASSNQSEHTETSYQNLRAGIFYNQNNDLNDHINTFFPDNKFNMQLYSWGLMFGFLKNRGANLSFAFDRFISQSITSGDSLSLKLSGSKFLYRFGPEITRGNVFNISPQFGIGYAGYTLVESIKNNQDTKQSFFNNNFTIENKYRNPAFILDGSLEMRMNFELITLALQGGYTYDVSKKTWRIRGNNILGGPSSSHTGAYIAFCIGFLIDRY